MTDAMVRHYPHNGLDIIVRLGGDHAVSHEVFHLDPREVHMSLVARPDNVPFGENAGNAALFVLDEHGSDLFPDQNLKGVLNELMPFNRPYLRSLSFQDIFQFHESLLSRVSVSPSFRLFLPLETP